MTIFSLRILIVTLMSLYLYFLFDFHFLSDDFPEMAISYLQWWQDQPLNSLQELLLQYGLIIEFFLLVSLIGMAFLLTWARFVFVGAALLAIVSDVFFSVPVLVMGRHIMLVNFISALSGIIIYAVFFTPLRDQFLGNPFSNR